MLTKRDKAIIRDLNKFRVMDRDSIAELHFAGLKNPISATNAVLLRLLRDGQIQRSIHYQPYVYFGPEVNIKQNSAKIGHFLAILNVYKEIRRRGAIETFLVEPKYGGKGLVEPDVYMKFRNTGFFIEVQRSAYSEKQMNAKIERYMSLYDSGIMAKPFPHVLLLSEQRYGPFETPFRVFQAETFTEFMQSLKQPQRAKVPNSLSGGIKIVVG